MSKRKKVEAPTPSSSDATTGEAPPAKPSPAALSGVECECPARKALERIEKYVAFNFDSVDSCKHNVGVMVRAALAVPCPCEELYAALEEILTPLRRPAKDVFADAHAALAKARGESE